MTFWKKFIAVMTVVFSSILGLMYWGDSPNDLLIGTWNEVEWHYEEMSDSSSFINQELNLEVHEHLVIHEAETWVFNKNGSLSLFTESGDTHTYSYNLLGQGYTLSIKDKHREESYRIENISKDRLELHFFLDLQTRGIVKLIFSKAQI